MTTDPSPIPYRGASTGLWQALTMPLMLFILMPILALFLRVSPADVVQNLSNRQVLLSIQLSLLTSLVTVLVTLIFGTPVAYLLSKKSSRFYRLVDTLVDIPTVLPPAVAGVALLMAFGRRGVFGSLLEPSGITIPFTVTAVIMAQTFIACPLYIKSAALGFTAVSKELEQAAELDGANRWQVFTHLFMPMSWSALLSGSVLTWARALGEFGATIIFAGNFPGRTQTMPLAIYIGFELDLNVAITLSAILIGISFFTILIVKGILHGRMNGSIQQ
jgi:molybdate transport system permease protein